jgi:hypothetical protein
MHFSLTIRPFVKILRVTLVCRVERVYQVGFAVKPAALKLMPQKTRAAFSPRRVGRDRKAGAF